MDLVAHLLPDPTVLDAQDTTVIADPALITLTVVSRQPTSLCPRCATPATRVHSRYCRTLADLPWAGYRSRLLLHVRRFFCAQPACPRKIFTERLPSVLAPWARRTHRLVRAHQQIGLALGGAAGVRLANALGFDGGVDLLLHAIRTAPLLA
ncbi:MAG: transposase family protein, partial [Herpetosiphonaceae bacterium]|nr:transposase family protein [Herpetosiphonaceae bacterium]